jgi:hypothetical protein
MTARFIRNKVNHNLSLHANRAKRIEFYYPVYVQIALPFLDFHFAANDNVYIVVKFILYKILILNFLRETLEPLILMGEYAVL